MRLPELFLRRMAELFREQGMTEEWAGFLSSFDETPARAYRFNALKGLDGRTFEALETRLLSEQGLDAGVLGRVPWSGDGRYIPQGLQPGRSLAARAGLFYIQEASAMLPAELLDCGEQGLKTLDLCAAPGGKSARLAARMAGEGLLWANDISASRAKVLLRNLEQLGVRNVVATVAEPRALARSLPQFFDRILLDAPCSGEGMFRRDAQAISSWERYAGEPLLDIQADLLEQAALLLAPGGELVYSTCTFNLAENEAQIARFLMRHPEFHPLPARLRLAGPSVSGVSPGLKLPEALQREMCERRTDLAEAALADALRIWPQRARGDGHFACLLKKGGVALIAPTPQTSKGETPEAHTGEARAAFLRLASTFMRPAALERLATLPLPRWRLEGQRLHLLPEPLPPLHLPAVKFLKTGCFLAELRPFSRGFKVRPTHAFLLSLAAEDLSRALRCSSGDPRLRAYLRGETLLPDCEGGEWDTCPEGTYLPLLWENWPLGWLKYESARLKNLYPPGWRS